MKRELKEYRARLIDTQIKLNESYDKLLVTLSGGALALSITFLKDVVGKDKIVFSSLLLVSWVFFVISLASILCEVLFGIHAYKKAVKQVDKGKIYNEKIGGKWSYASIVFHWVAAFCLIAGLLSISTFAYLNVEASNVREESTAKTTTESSANTKADTTAKSTSTN